MRLLFGILGGLALVGWAAFYIWVVGMACAFSGAGSSGRCTIPLPWQMRGEDLQILVLLPGSIVAVLFFLAWWFGRKR